MKDEKGKRKKEKGKKRKGSGKRKWKEEMKQPAWGKGVDQCCMPYDRLNV